MRPAPLPIVPEPGSREEAAVAATSAGCLTDYFRCPQRFVRLAVPPPGEGQPGYFLFGPEVTCFGRSSGAAPSAVPDSALPDLSGQVAQENGMVSLPFDPCEVASNLRLEQYAAERSSRSSSLLSRLYYLFRPFLPVTVRRHFQRFHLRNWEKIPFPRWPVDCSVDDLYRQLLLLAVRQSGEPIPFIWFWPEGRSAAMLMTHDVETTAGRDLCPALMDLDESYGIPASFQIVPEARYEVPPAFLASIRARGFEVVVHDLNHDGRLYKNRAEFLRRAVRINAYLEEFGTAGFRAAVLYRRQVWYDALRCSYDMSVPNVARLDPQRGGCCTVMPYFIGNIVELPVTMTQDYTIFNILNDGSDALWQRQIEIIRSRNGLMSFIVHPDYVVDTQHRAIFEDLLRLLARLRDQENVWVARPGDMNCWWRQRAAMQLLETADGGWRIEGEGSEHACLAWASERDGQLVLSLDQPSLGHFSA